MFELRVKTHFAAGHHIVGYQGNCARPHGHTWIVEVFIRVKDLDPIGMCFDFKKLKEVVNGVVDRWDHQDLNELDDFKKVNPTAEWIAKIAYDQISERLASEKVGVPAGAKVHRVTIWESEKASATYFAD